MSWLVLEVIWYSLKIFSLTSFFDFDTLKKYDEKNAYVHVEIQIEEILSLWKARAAIKKMSKYQNIKMSK